MKRERGGGGRAREPVPKVLTNVLFVYNSVHTMLIHVATDCIAGRVVHDSTLDRFLKSAAQPTEILLDLSWI